MEKVEIIAASPLFEMLSSQEMEYLAELARPLHFKSGQLVFEEGAPGDSIFVIARGEVEVVQKQPSGSSRTLASLSAPAFFGEMSLIDKENRSATARAMSDIDLLQLTVENLAAFRRQFRDGFTFVVINIARVLSSRLRETNLKVGAAG